MNENRRQQRLAGFEEPQAPDSPAKAIEPQDLHDKLVIVVDAPSLIYQVFHALPEMTSPSGQPVAAIHGFIRDVADLLERKQPDYLFCAFDLPGKTFRHEMFDPYKANRPEMPDDLQPQIPGIQRFLQALHIPVLAVPGYEADDLLATLARLTAEQGGRCLLVTSDKDCRQLITDQIHLYNIRKDQVIDTDEVIRQWSIRPDQVVDLQALWGDSTDNVPGVPGIGQKTASDLLGKYETLEGIFEHINDISGKKRRENLAANQDAAFLSRKLVKLDDRVPVDLDWPAAAAGPFNAQDVEDLCREFGFRRLQERLLGVAEKEPLAEWSADYQAVTSREELEQLVAAMAQQKRISVDTETTSTNPRWAEIVGYSFAWEAGVAYYLPVRGPHGETVLDPVETLALLRPVLEDPNIEKIGQNIKYDMVVLRGAGVAMAGISFDTMVADYLLAPGERTHSIDDIARRYLKHETIKIKELLGSGKKQKRMDEVPVKLVTPYAAEDADVSLRLAGLLHNELGQQQLDELFHSLEMPLIEVLAEMQYHGIRVDVPRLQQLSAKFGQRLEALEQQIYELAGREFNIESRKQLSDVLFQQLELPVLKKTKTGPSTDAEVLSQLADLHDLPAKIIEYRQFAKLKSTYVDALPLMVHPITGRVHTSFKQDVAATGRLSSTDPNLQNIPIRTETGREIRGAFTADPEGWKLLTADYSQIELRVLAHYSNDAALIRAFVEDQDIHALVASEVYGVPLDEVTSDMRRSAKAINFGIIYGQSPFGLAKALDITKDEAATFIDAYFERYPGVDKFMDQTLNDCRRNQFVSTALGRRRAVNGVRDAAVRGRQRNLPERIAINTVIQGSAADLIKQAMLRVHRRMLEEQLQARMLLQIHDELVFEAPPEELAQLSKLVDEEMTAAGQLSVPLKVDRKIGANWAECE
jgi:DNA polymerase-1